jgi:hypothetical protein
MAAAAMPALRATSMEIPRLQSCCILIKIRLYCLQFTAQNIAKSRPRGGGGGGGLRVAAASPPAGLGSKAQMLCLLDDSLLITVLSRASVKDLGRVACVARRFIAKQHFEDDDVERWSLVEESARIHVMSWYPEGVQALVRRRPSESWMRLAAAIVPLSQQLTFDRASGDPKTMCVSDTILTLHGDSIHSETECSAICEASASSLGRQYVEFTLLDLPRQPTRMDTDLDDREFHAVDVEVEVCFGLARRCTNLDAYTRHR